jgi:hypothetical protein
MAAVLALLAASGSQPASADLKLLEPYGGLYSGRTFLGSPDDKRPKDALQNQASRIDSPTQRFVISPLFGHSDDGGEELSFFGGTLGYASSADPRHPWQIQGSGVNNHVSVSGQGSANILQLDFAGKFVLYQPTDVHLPVVSFVGRYADLDGIGERYDVLLAADQAIGQRMFATLNAGWAHCTCDDVSDLVAGIGLTYVASPRLSFSADYTLRNDADRSDLWTVSASYALDRNSLVRIGGGKNSTLGVDGNQVFVSYVLKYDRK